MRKLLYIIYVRQIESNKTHVVRRKHEFWGSHTSHRVCRNMRSRGQNHIDAKKYESNLSHTRRTHVVLLNICRANRVLLGERESKSIRKAAGRKPHAKRYTYWDRIEHMTVIYVLVLAYNFIFFKKVYPHVCV